MRRAAAGLALALAASGCSYEFRNPAEQLGMGQALGRAVVDRGGGAEPVSGALVTLENAFSFDQVTRATGRFTLLSLPVGRHRVLFRKGAQLAGERFVDIAPGEDGKPEGVNLGDVRLRGTATVQGRFTLPASFAATGYARLVYDVTDEVTGQPAALSSVLPTEVTFTLRGLAVGEHRLRLAVAGDYDPLGIGSTERRTFGAPPLVVTIPETGEGQQLTLVGVPLDPQPAGSTFGALRFRIQGIGPGGPAAAAGASVELVDAVGFDPAFPGSATVVDTVAPDSAGWVQADEVPGLYVVRVLPPASGTGTSWNAPDPFRVLVRASALAELGTVYLLESFTGSAAAFTCFADAECTPGTCAGGRCQGGTPTTPTPVAPLTVPYCDTSEASLCAQVGARCGLNATGRCLLDCSGGPPGVGTCFDASGQCTPDGFVVSVGTTACP